LAPTNAHLECNLPLSYSFVGDLPDDGSAKAQNTQETHYKVTNGCLLLFMQLLD